VLGTSMKSVLASLCCALLCLLGTAVKGGFAIVTENGNVRRIDNSGAALFGVPAGFTEAR